MSRDDHQLTVEKTSEQFYGSCLCGWYTAAYGIEEIDDAYRAHTSSVRRGAAR